MSADGALDRLAHYGIGTDAEAVRVELAALRARVAERDQTIRDLVAALEEIEGMALFEAGYRASVVARAALAKLGGCGMSACECCGSAECCNCGFTRERHRAALATSEARREAAERTAEELRTRLACVRTERDAALGAYDTVIADRQNAERELAVSQGAYREMRDQCTDAMRELAEARAAAAKAEDLRECGHCGAIADGSCCKWREG